MQLAPNLSFCRIQGQYVFLDLGRDRYFGLGSDMSGAFDALLNGTADSGVTSRLERCGLLVAGSDNAIMPRAPDMPKASLLDQTSASAHVAPVITLAWHFVRLRARLKREGIAGPASDLAALRDTTRHLRSDRGLSDYAAAYDLLSLLRGAHDLCLPHSLALATQLARQGFAAEVVLGVRLRPFGAHCWVECQERLVNDRFDRLRSYTPIRRL